MKVTKVIFVVVFSIICVFLIVSASSIYASAENDLKNVEMAFEHLDVSNSTVSADFQVSAQDSNELPSTLSILSHNLTVNPYSNTMQDILIPLNMTHLSCSGWPVSSVLFYVKAIISEFIGGIGMDKISKNISTLLPSIFTKTSLTQGNSNDSYNMVLNDFITIASSVLTIGIYEGSKFMGNLSASSSSGMIGGNTTFSGILNQSGLTSQMSNISIEIFGMKIKL